MALQPSYRTETAPQGNLLQAVPVLRFVPISGTNEGLVTVPKGIWSLDPKQLGVSMQWRLLSRTLLVKLPHQQKSSPLTARFTEWHVHEVTPFPNRWRKRDYSFLKTKRNPSDFLIPNLRRTTETSSCAPCAPESPHAVNSCPAELGHTAAAQQPISTIHRHFSLKFSLYRAIQHLFQQWPWPDPRLSAQARDAKRGASWRLTNGHLLPAEIDVLKPSRRNGKAALQGGFCTNGFSGFEWRCSLGDVLQGSNKPVVLPRVPPQRRGDGFGCASTPLALSCPVPIFLLWMRGTRAEFKSLRKIKCSPSDLPFSEWGWDGWNAPTWLHVGELTSTPLSEQFGAYLPTALARDRQTVLSTKTHWHLVIAISRTRSLACHLPKGFSIVSFIQGFGMIAGSYFDGSLIAPRWMSNARSPTPEIQNQLIAEPLALPHQKKYRKTRQIFHKSC